MRMGSWAVVAAALPEGAHVLDAGCGVGRHLELLREWGFEAAGLEPDPEMAERAAIIRELENQARMVAAANGPMAKVLFAS